MDAEQEARGRSTTRRAILGGAAGVGALAGLGVVAPQASAAPMGSRGRFDGKVVLITGGTSGIGAAAARAFAAAGASVSFCGRRTQLGGEVERSIRRTGGKAVYIPADVRVPTSVGGFVDQTVKRYGRIDIAFNNAGIQTTSLLHETTVDQWDNTIDTNARGVFLSMKYELQQMLRQRAGHIIVNSSVGALIGRPQLSLYQASKRAILALVNSAALEYGESGIRVNAILPGITDTAMIRPPGFDDPAWEEAKKVLGQLNVDGLKTVASPEMIATGVLALADENLGYMTGVSLPVDGGIAAGRRMLLPEQ